MNKEQETTMFYLGNPQGEKTQKNLSLIMHDTRRVQDTSHSCGSKKISQFPCHLRYKSLLDQSLFDEGTTVQYYQPSRKNPSTSYALTSIPHAHRQKYSNCVLHTLMIKSLSNNQKISTLRQRPYKEEP